MPNNDEKLHLRITRPNKKYGTFRFKLNDINTGTKQQDLLINETEKGRTNSGQVGKDELGRIFNSDEHSSSIIHRTTLPYVKLYEFQPDMLFKWTQHLKLVVRSVEMSAAAIVNAGKEVKNWMEVFADVDIDFDGRKGKREEDDATSSLAANFFIDDDKYGEQVFENPLELYRSFFNGKYVRSFELPYNDDTFLDANGASGWNTSNDINIPGLTGYLETIWKTVANLGVVDLPPIPRWKWDGTGEGDYFNISTEFNLVNNDLKSLGKNFRFLVEMIQGPFWIQYNTRQLPSNIYSVEIPGTIFLQFASIGIDIEPVGNKRKLNKGHLEDKFSDTFSSEFIESHGDKNQIFFPDAWKVVVRIKSLLPNNFNNYMNYLLIGTGGGDQFIDVNPTKGFNVTSELEDGHVVNRYR